ncbi:LAFA_0G07580g1_1 [Lachancea sp. 'fantastica']|nr:LAFA_0G07580g1_1 [Lachancea sp. 'fantastica']
MPVGTELQPGHSVPDTPESSNADSVRSHVSVPPTLAADTTRTTGQQFVAESDDLETAKPTSAPQNTPEPAEAETSRFSATKSPILHEDPSIAPLSSTTTKTTIGAPSITGASPQRAQNKADDSDNADNTATGASNRLSDRGPVFPTFSAPRQESSSPKPLNSEITVDEKSGTTAARTAAVIVNGDRFADPDTQTPHDQENLETNVNSSKSSPSSPTANSVQLPHITTLLTLPKIPEPARHNHAASPNSILTGRNVFATSASRNSPSDTGAGKFDKLPLRGASSFSGVSSSSRSGIGAGGSTPLMSVNNSRTFLTPHRLSFNTHQMATDPHVTLVDHNKIDISSLLNSRGEDVYTLRSREQLSSSPAFQGLGHDENESGAFSDENNNNNNKNRNNRNDNYNGNENDNDHDNDANDQEYDNRHPKQSHNLRGKTGRSKATKTLDFQSASTVVVPPPRTQPGRIKSKFDEVRSRLLLDPNAIPPRPDNFGSSSSARSEDDFAAAGAAAAIITKMRSSPYEPHDEPSASSRPGSASFRHHMRPVVRIHQREYEPNESDESAVIEDDTEDESYEEGSGHATDKISWNKSGMKKRVTRRQSAPSSNFKRRHSVKVEESNPSSRTSRHSSTSSASTVTSLLSAAKLLGKKPSDKPVKDESKGPHWKGKDPALSPPTSPNHSKVRRKNAAGSRSRSGCWICRLRKKKCTEEKPSCHNCMRLNLQCFYDHTKPDFISDPAKKNEKLEEIKKKTKEAKRMAMRRRP